MLKKPIIKANSPPQSQPSHPSQSPSVEINRQDAIAATSNEEKSNNSTTANMSMQEITLPKLQRVQIFARLRPSIQPSKSIKIDAAAHSIQLNLPKSRVSFSVDGILNSQEDVFASIGKSSVSNVCKGIDASIIAYGQVASGKTYSLIGSRKTYPKRGLIPRILAELFERLPSESHSSQKLNQEQTSIYIGMYEIYNETVRDLLADHQHAQQSTNNTDADTSIEEDSSAFDDRRTNDELVSVKGTTTVKVATEQQALALFFAGDAARTTATHPLHSSLITSTSSSQSLSSRSHCIFTVHVERQFEGDNSEQIQCSTLTIADLAGCERVGRSGATGMALTEGTAINRSLSALQQCVVAAAERNREHIPYRQSKLTHALKTCLSPRTMTSLLITIHQSDNCIEDTVNTFAFGMQMKGMPIAPQPNIRIDPAALIRKQERLIAHLKEELAMHDAVVYRRGLQYDIYSEEERMDVRDEIEEFIHGEIPDIEFDNLRKVRECFHMFRKIVVEARSALAVITPTESLSVEEVIPANTASAPANLAPLINAKATPPPPNITKNAPPAAAAHPMPSTSPLPPLSRSTSLSKESAPTTPPQFSPPTEDVAMNEFAEGEGTALWAEVTTSRNEWRECKADLRKCVELINATVNEIKHLEALSRSNSDNFKSEIKEVENPESSRQQSYTDAKLKYKTLLSQRSELEADVKFEHDAVKQSQQAFATAFLDWYTRTYGCKPESEVERAHRLQCERITAAASENEEKRNDEAMATGSFFAAQKLGVTWSRQQNQTNRRPRAAFH